MYKQSLNETLNLQFVISYTCVIQLTCDEILYIIYSKYTLLKKKHNITLHKIMFALSRLMFINVFRLFALMHSMHIQCSWHVSTYPDMCWPRTDFRVSPQTQLVFFCYTHRVNLRTRHFQKRLDNVIFNDMKL